MCWKTEEEGPREMLRRIAKYVQTVETKQFGKFGNEKDK